MPRELELPSSRLRVIQITAPDGFEIFVKRPKDVVNLQPNGGVAITEWNWTNTMGRSLWFGVDLSKNVTGTFYYAFPVITPSLEKGMPYDNIWDVQICADSPFCYRPLLSVPLPGFFFGEVPDHDLSPEAQAILTGSRALRKTPSSILIVTFLTTTNLFGLF